MHLGRPLAHFGLPFGSLWLPFGSLLAPFWLPLAPFWLPWVSFWHHWAYFWLPLAHFWLTFGVLWLTFIVSWSLFPYFYVFSTKMSCKIQFLHNFNSIFDFCVVSQPFSVRTLSSLGPRAELLPQATEIDVFFKPLKKRLFALSGPLPDAH